jgi:hypothetical protein
MWMVGSALFALPFSPKIATIPPTNFEPLVDGVGAWLDWFLFRWHYLRRNRKRKNYEIAEPTDPP